MDPLSIGLSAAPGLIGGIAQIFGGKRRRREEDRAMAQYRSLADVLQNQTDSYNNQLNEGYFNTENGQAMLTKLGQQSETNQRSIDATSAVGGLTDESKIAMMGRNNQAHAQGTSNLAESAQRWRNMLIAQRGQSQGQQIGLSDRLYSAGQNNRRNFNNSLSNVLQPLQSGVSSYLQSTTL